MFNNNIVEVPVELKNSLTSMVLEQGAAEESPAGVNRRLFTIRAADSPDGRSLANILVNRMYATRGYHSTSLMNDPNSNRITLIAGEGDAVVGTITIGFDSPSKLLVDSLFSAEVEALRHSGLQLCEFIKLAVDGVVRSKRVLASLFHVAYIIVHRINAADVLLIEVNPRHVRFYERMLGFQVKGPERLNLRVNAPAVLLALDLSHAYQQIARFGGRQELGDTERSLYPYFFSAAEEAGIINRLR